MDSHTFMKILNWIAQRGSIGQCKAPLFWLVNKVEKVHPHTIIEIGLGIGGSMKIWEQMLAPGDLYVGVDIRETIESEIFWDWRHSDRQIKIIVGDSTDPATVEKVKATLGNRQADFLFIDGSHSYENVVYEFEHYTPFVRSGGLVGFHDLEAHLAQKYEITAVKKFFHELHGQKETTSRWMRPYLGAPASQEGDDPFVKECKEMMKNYHSETKDNGMICTGIWWKP